MKKFLSVLAIAISLAGCGGGSQTQSPASAKPTAAKPAATQGPQPPTEAEINGYAQSVDISVQCAKAYLATHNGQFPNSVKDLADFKASAPPDARCG